MPSGSLVMSFLKASNASLSCGKHLTPPLALAPFRWTCRGSACDTGKKLQPPGGGHDGKQQELRSGAMHSDPVVALACPLTGNQLKLTASKVLSHIGAMCVLLNSCCDQIIWVCLVQLHKWLHKQFHNFNSQTTSSLVSLSKNSLSQS
jgi:hypothetical protein